LQVGDTGPVESARRSNSRVLGSPFSGLSGQKEKNSVLETNVRWKTQTQVAKYCSLETRLNIVFSMKTSGIMEATPERNIFHNS
jgi:hypothetical protein